MRIKFIYILVFKTYKVLVLENNVRGCLNTLTTNNMNVKMLTKFP